MNVPASLKAEMVELATNLGRAPRPSDVQTWKAAKRWASDAEAELASRTQARMRVSGDVAAAGFVEALQRVLRRYPGEAMAVLEVGSRTLLLGDGFRVDRCAGLWAELKELGVERV